MTQKSRSLLDHLSRLSHWRTGEPVYVDLTCVRMMKAGKSGGKKYVTLWVFSKGMSTERLSASVTVSETVDDIQREGVEKAKFLAARHQE